LNDTRIKTIIIDQRYSPLVKRMFELYARGDQTMADIADFLKENGAITSGGRTFKDDKVKSILQNPFYYGHFIYNGELHEGRHTPIVSKALWDKVQAVIEQRGHTKPQTKEPIPFLGVLRCAFCGMAITAETKTKTQMNGNTHSWTYYRCSRKNKAIKCVEPAIREKDLLPQISALLGKYEMTGKTYGYMTDRIVQDEQAENTDNVYAVANLKDKIASLNSKQKILLDSYLDQDIDRQTFLAKKSEILSEKKSLEESLASLTANQNAWIEPMRNWLKTAKSICYLRETDDLNGQKAVLSEIFGSNLAMRGKTLIALGDKNTAGAGSKTAFRRGAESSFCLWQELKNLNEKVAKNGDNSELFLKLARFYEFARTHFATKCQK